MTQQVTVGCTVLYRIGRGDREAIKAKWDEDRINGNIPSVGQDLPAVVVAHWGGTTLNLKVNLDGPGEYWATSRLEGDEPGEWHWPVLVPARADEPENSDNAQAEGSQ